MGKFIFKKVDNANDGQLANDQGRPQQRIKVDRHWLLFNYQTGQDKIESGHLPALADIVKNYQRLRRQDVPLKVKVIGCASNFIANPAKFSQADNEDLAERRAFQVRERLKADGIAGDDLMGIHFEIRGKKGDNDEKLRAVEVQMGPKVNDRYSVFITEIFNDLAGVTEDIVIRDDQWRIQKSFRVDNIFDPGGRIPLERIIPPLRARRGMALRGGNPLDPEIKRCIGLDDFSGGIVSFFISDNAGDMTGVTSTKSPFTGITPNPAPGMRPPLLFKAFLISSSKVEDVD